MGCLHTQMSMSVGANPHGRGQKTKFILQHVEALSQRQRPLVPQWCGAVECAKLVMGLKRWHSIKKLRFLICNIPVHH